MVSELSAVPAGPARRLIVGITGASGAVYGVRLLERAREIFDDSWVSSVDEEDIEWITEGAST